MKLQKCEFDADCPVLASKCNDNFKVCVGSRETRIGCAELETLDLLSTRPFARGRHKAALQGRLEDRLVTVKMPSNLTSKGRSQFRRSVVEEVLMLQRAPDKVLEVTPRFWGACLESHVPVVLFEHFPVCFSELDALDIPWCTRLYLLKRVASTIQAFHYAGDSGGFLLCDLKPEQFCFTPDLQAHLIDLNQVVPIRGEEHRRVGGGVPCDRDEKPARDGVYWHAAGLKKPDCFTKCFTSLHRSHPRAIMSEEWCDADTSTCPGLDALSAGFVFCHLFLAPLTLDPRLPGEVRTELLEIFSRCTLEDREKRVSLTRTLKTISGLLEARTTMRCLLDDHQRVLEFLRVRVDTNDSVTKLTEMIAEQDEALPLMRRWPPEHITWARSMSEARARASSSSSASIANVDAHSLMIVTFLISAIGLSLVWMLRHNSFLNPYTRREKRGDNSKLAI